MSLVEYYGSQEVSDTVEPTVGEYLNRWTFSLLLVATVLTAGTYLMWSYREGSFSRLVMSGVVAVFSVVWSYLFYGGLANWITIEDASLVFTFIMLVFMALACVRAVWALVRTYHKSRSTYMGWRIRMLDKEAAMAKPADLGIGPTPSGTSPDISPIDVPAIVAGSRGPTFFVERVPSQLSAFSASSYSFDVVSADQGGSRTPRGSTARPALRQDAARMTSTKASYDAPGRSMASYMAITKMPASKIIKRATEHFGALSGGVMVKSKTDDSLILECPDGYVTIKVCPSKSSGRKNEVDIETSRMDKQVKEFLARL